MAQPEPAPGETSEARRPVASRDTRWAQRFAARLAASGLTPNAISCWSVLCAAVGAMALLGAEELRAEWGLGGALLGYGLAIAGIVGRLLCNLFDGMVAMEGGKATPSGGVYNELPDRLSDVLLLVAAGYAAGGEWGVPLGWTCAVLAVLTAYVRELGASLGAGHAFLGPMAKQHRMAMLILGCLGALFWSEALQVALALIAVGALLTAARRTGWIVRRLEDAA